MHKINDEIVSKPHKGYWACVFVLGLLVVFSMGCSGGGGDSVGDSSSLPVDINNDAPPQSISDLVGTWAVTSSGNGNDTFDVITAYFGDDGEILDLNLVMPNEGWCFPSKSDTASWNFGHVSIDSATFGFSIDKTSGTNSYGNEYDTSSIAGVFTSNSTIVGTYDISLSAVGYCSNTGHGTWEATKVSGSTTSDRVNSVVGTVMLDTSPYSLVVSPDGKYVYVADYLGANVYVIQTSDATLVKTIAVSYNSSIEIVMSPDGNYVYVPNSYDDTVSIIRTLDNTVVATVAVGDSPKNILLTPDGNYAYVANWGGNTISVIQTVSPRIIQIRIASFFPR